MAQSTRVQKLEEGLELVSVLGQFLNNKKLCAELADEVKRLNTLTSEEEHRLTECKLLMQRKDTLIADITEKEDDLANMIAVHERKIKGDTEALKNWSDDERDKIEASHKDLDKRQEVMASEENRLRQWESQLTEKAKLAAGLFNK